MNIIETIAKELTATKKLPNFKAGDSIIVIEAMKMENEIQAAISGTVIVINISKGDEVSPNETLLEIQP